MTFLVRERRQLEQFAPGFDNLLSTHSLEQLEKPDGTAVSLLRATRLSSLLIPSECGGLGASPSEAVAVQRALGARAPSLAVATAMHHFSIATLLQYSLYEAEGRDMLGLVASQGYLVASGFAEARPDASVLDASVKAVWNGSTYLLQGSKKPCSLSRSMDLLSAGVTVVRGDAKPTRGVAVVFANAPGLQRRAFWGTPVLAATESDELVLDGVEVPQELLITIDSSDDNMHPIEIGGLCWFTLMITASYLGIASGLVERVLLRRKGADCERVHLLAELESAMSALEGLSRRIVSEPIDMELLQRAQLVKFALQEALERASARAAELLGGVSFVSSQDVSYLLAATRALAFHPPSRSASAPSLAAAFAGTEQAERSSSVDKLQGLKNVAA